MSNVDIIESNEVGNVIPNPLRQVVKNDKVDTTPAYIKEGITPIPQATSPILPEAEDLQILPEIGDYVLMVKGEVALYGSSSNILQEVKSILYETHGTIKATLDDLIILKRIALKVGVFYDE